tara:strand:+ start:445 stop:762 length:318 start_codon:yes stop_codon:yes gene_type:complete
MNTLNLDQHLITDAILTLENEAAFYQHFLLPYQKNLIKKIKKNTFDLEKAISGLEKIISVFYRSCKNMDVCRYKYKYIPTVYAMNKNERIEVAKGLIDNIDFKNL